MARGGGGIGGGIWSNAQLDPDSVRLYQSVSMPLIFSTPRKSDDVYSHRLCEKTTRGRVPAMAAIVVNWVRLSTSSTHTLTAAVEERAEVEGHVTLSPWGQCCTVFSKLVLGCKNREGNTLGYLSTEDSSRLTLIRLIF